MAKKEAKRSPKPAARKKSARPVTSAESPSNPPPPPGSGGSSDNVPRENVGAAVQAAVSFENASIVTAKAIDDTRKFFRVTWQ